MSELFPEFISKSIDWDSLKGKMLRVCVAEDPLTGVKVILLRDEQAETYYVVDEVRRERKEGR